MPKGSLLENSPDLVSLTKFWYIDILTLTLQKSRVLQIQGVKGEAVVSYRKPLTMREMWYPRLSQRVDKPVTLRLL